MLYKLSQLQGHRVEAADDGIGWVEDFYFDDLRWGVRYLVVDTGGWITGRQVLISPLAVRQADFAGGVMLLGLTRQQIESSPPLAEREPLGRQYEIAHADFYGHPYYWQGVQLWGEAARPFPRDRDLGEPPVSSVAEPSASPPELERAPGREARLFSAAKVTGCKLEATDGSIGHLGDLLMDDETWGIRHLLLDTRSWLPGGHVLVDPDVVADIDPNEGLLRLKVSREVVKNSPAYE